MTARRITEFAIEPLEKQGCRYLYGPPMTVDVENRRFPG